MRVATKETVSVGHRTSRSRTSDAGDLPSGSIYSVLVSQLDRGCSTDGNALGHARRCFSHVAIYTIQSAIRTSGTVSTIIDYPSHFDSFAKLTENLLEIDGQHSLGVL